MDTNLPPVHPEAEKGASPLSPQKKATGPGGLLSKKHRVTDLRIMARLKQRKGRVLWDMACSFAIVFLLQTSPASASVGREMTGYASWYSSADTCRFNHHEGCPTASGKSIYELEKHHKLFAASWKYGLGKKVRVTNEQNSKSVVVEICDRGPAKRLDRIIDLGKDAFQKISPLSEGLIRVRVEVIP